MRFRTVGDLDRVDIAPFVPLVRALWREWTSLRFDAEGFVVNPVTGETVDDFQLISGAHRTPGSTYQLTTRTPIMELPDDVRDDFAREERELREADTPDDEMSAFRDRRAEAMVQVGVDVSTSTLTVERDNRSVGRRGSATPMHLGWSRPRLSMHSGRRSRSRAKRI